jgi:hypothetical protein
MIVSETEYYRLKVMRRDRKYKVAVIFLLALLMGGTAVASATLMGVTLAIAIVALVVVLVILFAISQFKK